MARTMLKGLAVLAAAAAVPGCGGSDDDVEDTPLFPLFFWAYLLGGSAKSAADGATAVVEGGVAGGAAEVRWFNETAQQGGVAEGTSSWRAQVPVLPGVNHVTVTAFDAWGNFDSATARLFYDGATVVMEGGQDRD